MQKCPFRVGNTVIYKPITDLGATLGSGTFVIDHDSSELVEHITYQSYGATESDYRPSRWSPVREDMRYTDHWDDAEIGLSYLGARYYSPALARFISPDPFAIHGISGDLNPYAYALGSPFRYFDPFGLEPLDGGLDPGGAPPTDTTTSPAAQAPAAPDAPPDASGAAPGNPPAQAPDPDQTVVYVEVHGGPNINSIMDDIYDGMAVLGAVGAVRTGNPMFLVLAVPKATSAFLKAANSRNAPAARVIHALSAVVAVAPLAGPALESASVLLDAVEEVGLVGAGEPAAADATGFLGRSGFQLTNLQGALNSAETIGGQLFTGHALDMMQARGIMPTVVQNAIETGAPFTGNTAGTIGYFDTVNNLRVIVNADTNAVITVIPGGP